MVQMSKDKGNNQKTKAASPSDVARALRRKGVEIPTDFEERMKGTQIITKDDAKETFRLAKFWEECIEEDDFPNFITNLFEKIYMIGTVVVNSNPKSKDFFVGVKAKLKERKEGEPSLLDDCDMTTIVSHGYKCRFKATASWHKLPEVDFEI